MLVQPRVISEYWIGFCVSPVLLCEVQSVNVVSQSSPTLVPRHPFCWNFCNFKLDLRLLKSCCFTLPDSIMSVSAYFQVHEVYEENVQTLDSICLCTTKSNMACLVSVKTLGSPIIQNNILWVWARGADTAETELQPCFLCTMASAPRKWAISCHILGYVLICLKGEIIQC